MRQSDRPWERLRPVRAVLAVDAGLREPKPFDRISLNKVFPDDLLYIINMDAAVPDRIRIDHNDGAMFALVKASGLVCPHLMLKASFLDGVLEG